MSVCTFGFYELYWCYRNWQRIKERSREDLSPFWRAFFAPFWGFSLFERVQESAERRKLGVGWSAGFLGVLYFVLSITWRLPDPWWLISMLTLAPFIPVVQTVRAINATEPAAEGPNAAYSGGNIATVIIGGLLVVLAVVDAFIPAEVGV